MANHSDRGAIFGAQMRETKGHRAPDTTRSDHKNRARIRIPHRAPIGCDETGMVGVVSRQTTVIEDNRVDRANPLHVRFTRAGKLRGNAFVTVLCSFPACLCNSGELDCAIVSPINPRQSVMSATLYIGSKTQTRLSRMRSIKP